LNYDDAVQNQVPEGERAPQARDVSGRVGHGASFTLAKQTPIILRR
jgi:hypothetical protein